MNKKNISMITVFAIALVIFTVIYFAVPFPRLSASIIAYVFSVISVIAGYFITDFAFKNGSDVKSKVYGFPVFRVGYIYMAAQIIFTLIIAAAEFAKPVPNWISVLISVIILCLAAIGVIATDNARDIITAQEEAFSEQTRKVKYFKLDMDSVIDKCKDAELKKKLEKFAEELKYSDPVSSDELESIEKKIADGIGNLSELVNKDNAAANDKLEELTILLSDRNRRCRALKK